MSDHIVDANKMLERELADMTAFRDSEMRWANQYKQERDQAIEELAEYQRTEPLKLAERNELIKELNKVIKERDEARACLREALQLVNDLFSESHGGAYSGVEYNIDCWSKAAGLEDEQ